MSNFFSELLNLFGKKEAPPIDNKRRPFTFDEKVYVIEKNVLRRGRAMCEICGARENLSIDHIKPISKGGHNGLDNLRLL